MLAERYTLDWQDDFDGPGLDPANWIPHHLPQWSSRARSAANYELRGNGLSLLIEADQAPWCPEWDGPTRVSSLQTGTFAGRLGTTVGQHRFHPDAVVREEQEPKSLRAPELGVVAARARAVPDPRCMVALWMIGYEDRPEHSGEICVFEIFGRDVEPKRARVGMGVHPFRDPSLTDDFEAIGVALDVCEPHEYAAAWEADLVRFFIDGVEVRSVGQSPRYPMQLMLGIYEFGEGRAGAYPKRFEVEWVKVYRPAVDHPV